MELKFAVVAIQIFYNKKSKNDRKKEGRKNVFLLFANQWYNNKL